MGKDAVKEEMSENNAALKKEKYLYIFVIVCGGSSLN